MKLLLVLMLIINFGCGSDSSSGDGEVLTTPESNPSPTPTPRPNPRAILCERNYRVLPAVDPRSFLAITNFGAGGIGRCRGTVIWSQRLALLTKFHENENHLCNREWQIDGPCYAWADRIFEKLNADKAVEIVGFKNVYHFTSHPEIASRLRGYIAGVSSRYSAFTLEFNHGERTQIGNTFKEAWQRARRRQIPYLAVKGTRYLDDHAIMAYKIIAGDKRTELKLCIKDPNYVNPYENCQNYLTYNTETEEVYYVNQSGENEYLSLLEIMSDENERVTRYIGANYSFCNK